MGIHSASSHNQKKNNKFKNKNNQDCQKIKLYGSSITKELKKKHSPRRVRGAETSSQSRKDVRQGGTGGPGRVRQWLEDWVVPHLHAVKLGEITGE